MKSSYAFFVFVFLALQIQAQEKEAVPGVERLLTRDTSSPFLLLEAATIPEDLTLLRRLSASRWIVRQFPLPTQAGK